MIHIRLDHVAKRWGDECLFEDITFSAAYGERIGLVGINGSGKSTLLEILSGHIRPDAGSVMVGNASSAAILRQNPMTDEALAEIQVDSFPEDVRKYMRFMQLDIGRTEDLSCLSGGERTKLALCLLLAGHPKLLLLDEPTNNMDFDGVRTLIGILGSYHGTLLVVSHDRYFLDSLVSRVIEIENGSIASYQGNYSDYRREKAKLFDERVHRYEDFKKEQQHIQGAISQVKNWSRKAHRDSTKPDPSGLTMGVKEKKRAKAKKLDKKVKNDVRRLERLISEGEKRPAAEKSVRFAISADVSHGKRILQAAGLSKGFGAVTLFSDSNFSIARGEKAALWGPNGCGKSTLAAMICGREKPDAGELWVSPSSPPFLLPQTVSNLPPGQTPLEYLTDVLGIISAEDRALLANIGITARHMLQRIETLSYGEQMKLVLAEPILAQRDFLILDEPTNHLDIHMRETLEATLAEYPGTLLLISHDLRLMKRVCDKVLVFDGGQILRLEYSFEEYMEKQGLQDSPRA
ncbi:MAG: ABC-F family ATP-binding cassette domain-containing protein [Eubacteriales bacterium]